MTFQTVEGVLHPDGKVTLPAAQLPSKPVCVMVTLLDAPDEDLSAIGDYAANLADYENRLARGEIRWR